MIRTSSPALCRSDRCGNGRYPSDIAITMHLCRGNYRSTFMGTGGYDPVAESVRSHQGARLFHGIRHRSRRHLRAAATGPQRPDGGARPDHYQDRGAQVQGCGRRRIEEAAKFVDLDALCLSPQCGFASSEEGNVLSGAAMGEAQADRRGCRRGVGGDRRRRTDDRGRATAAEYAAISVAVHRPISVLPFACLQRAG